MEKSTDPTRSAGGAQPQDRSLGRAIERVREALAGMRYGHVTVVVQDGVIVQVERTVKQRLPQE